jgi:hypothetical protein
MSASAQAVLSFMHAQCNAVSCASFCEGVKMGIEVLYQGKLHMSLSDTHTHTDVRGQRAEGRGQRAEDRGQKGRRQVLPVR